METKTPQYFIDALLPLALPKAYTYCITSKKKDQYSLNGFDGLESAQKEELKLICEEKILN